jgi:hypothetical protein
LQPVICAKMENYTTNTIKVRNVLSDIRDGLLETSPEWQRSDVWTPKLRINFIDTVLKHLPIPQVTLWRRPGGKSIVVDGRQRITTLAWFRDGKIPVGKTNIKRYADLTEEEQTVFNDTPILVLEFPQTTDVEDICDYFERINAGGKTLSHGELMNNRISSSAIVQEVHRLFFSEESDFQIRWTELFGEIDGETKRMSHLENTVPYLTSSMFGVTYLTKSFPIITDKLKAPRVDVVEHLPLFMERLYNLLDVVTDINTVVPEWTEKQSWKGGLPLLRQIASIWYTIINPTILGGRDVNELWSAFYLRAKNDTMISNVWDNMLRKNAKAKQLAAEVEFALKMTQ